jgi:hypothetical protein
MSLFRDERNKVSLARVLLFIVVLYTLALAGADSIFGFGVGAAVWSMLSGMTLMFTGWAAGPRIAQYLFPQLSAFVSGIGAAKASRAEPNLYRDDERGSVGK